MHGPMKLIFALIGEIATFSTSRMDKKCTGFRYNGKKGAA